MYILKRIQTEVQVVISVLMNALFDSGGSSTIEMLPVRPARKFLEVPNQVLTSTLKQKKFWSST